MMLLFLRAQNKLEFARGPIHNLMSWTQSLFFISKVHFVLLAFIFEVGNELSLIILNFVYLQQICLPAADCKTVWDVADALMWGPKLLSHCLYLDIVRNQKLLTVASPALDPSSNFCAVPVICYLA